MIKRETDNSEISYNFNKKSEDDESSMETVLNEFTNPLTTLVDSDSDSDNDENQEEAEEETSTNKP